MSPSKSPSPKPDQKLKAIVVDVEEKRTISNNPKQEYSPQEAVPERTITEVVSERKTTERPYFGLEDYVRAEKIMMKKLPLPRENDVLTCNICNRGFPSANVMLSHQRTHKLDQEVERTQLKKMEPRTSNSVFGGFSQGDPLSNDTISFGPFESKKGVRSSVRSTTFPSFSRGTKKGMSMGYPVTPLLSHIFNHHSVSKANHLGIYSGPFKYGGGGSKRDYPSMFNGGIPMVPPATPYGFSNVNRYSPHDLSLDLSLGRHSNPTRSRNNKKKKSYSHGVSSLELSVGPSKFTGGSNNNRSVYTSLNGRVAGGVTTDLNIPLAHPLPLPPPPTTNLSKAENVLGSSYQLDSVTRNVPLAHPLPLPPPPTTNRSNDENDSGSSYLLDSMTRNVLLAHPLPPPPPTTNLSTDEIVSGSSYPLASITRDVPLAHPLPLPPLNTNLSTDENVSGSSYPLDSVTRNVPLPHPLPLPPTTNFSNDENVSGSSYLKKLISDANGKN